MRKSPTLSLLALPVLAAPQQRPHHVLAEYVRAFQRGSVGWRFLTAESEERLDRILDDYDQYVIRDRAPDGTALTTMPHMLRVYVIDEDERVRNTYSPSYLHPDLLLADIHTVMQSE